MCDDKDEDNCCSCCSLTCKDRCFVVTVTVQILIGIFSYWFLVIIPWSWWSSVAGIINIVCLHVVFSLLVISYYKAMHTNPGFVEVGWVPSGFTPEELEQVKEDSRTYKGEGPDEIADFYRPRYCQHCKQFKPPRSHHCRDLNACVLRMDHYCPWVYNAVGYRNHKFFFLFLAYASAALTYFLIVLSYRVYHDIRYFDGPKHTLMFSIPEIVVIMINYAMTLPVTIGIVSLFVYQFGLILNNVTSIEEYTVSRFKRLAQRRGMEKDFSWFYDFGAKYNFKQVMGESVSEWWKPTVPKHIVFGNGAVYRTRLFTNAPTTSGFLQDDVPRVVVQNDEIDANVQRRATAQQKSEEQIPLMQ